MLICVNIDGTIADIRPRALLAGAAPDREARYSEHLDWLKRLQPPELVAVDPTIPEVVALLRLVGNQFGDYKIVYVTGRDASLRDVTERWLAANKLPIGTLYMRPDGNHVPAAVYKEDVMKRLERRYGLPILVIDDDGSGDCEAMYKRNGWRFLKVS